MTATIAQAHAIWDVLEMLYEITGMLPERSTPYRLRSGDDILKCAEMVLEDKVMWRLVPNEIKLPLGEVAYIRGLADPSLDDGEDPPDNVEIAFPHIDYTEYVTRDELRQALKNLLNDSL
jgi:hypothetical protein